jgi:hypothetical protein
MFFHVVMFTWRPGTSADEVKVAAGAMKDLFAQTAGLLGFDMGTDEDLQSGRFGAELGLASEKADFCVVMRFDGAESWHAYNADPRHREVVRKAVGKLLARRISVQFQV